MEQFLKHTLGSEEKKGLLSLDSELSIAQTSGWLNSPPLSNEELEGISLPCLVFCGEEDQGGFYPGAKECASHIPNAEFISLSGLDHPAFWSRSDIVLPHIKEFLAKVNK
jgi:pimeloyl-ACP methyl ester carboxylesterase